MDFSDEELDSALSANSKPPKVLKFHVELEEVKYLCGVKGGGLSLAEIMWKVQEDLIKDAIRKCGSKAGAAEALGISPQTIWNTEQGKHK